MHQGLQFNYLDGSVDMEVQMLTYLHVWCCFFETRNIIIG